MTREEFDREFQKRTKHGYLALSEGRPVEVIVVEIPLTEQDIDRHVERLELSFPSPTIRSLSDEELKDYLFAGMALRDRVISGRHFFRQDSSDILLASTPCVVEVPNDNAKLIG